ncbi:hypothetical protein MRB53_031122 [Persea americana]|uniref:Uncharacterized protein n=1 Tax=Persea americana TaxID=3435 RepID=A0ACC2KNE6_PERAE|nr:hypothetical protein MRB53_031122 [Persea americana]
MISKSVREALDEPLNYARIDLADIIPPDVDRTIYLDSDLIVVDDIRKVWGVVLSDKVVAATEYCHANFTTYFTPAFWSLHPGPISLLHWSGKGKPWLRLDSRKPCNVDHLWASYDLFRSSSLTLEAYKIESKEDEMREEEEQAKQFLKSRKPVSTDRYYRREVVSIALFLRLLE